MPPALRHRAPRKPCPDLEDFDMRSQPPFDFRLPRAALLAALGLVAVAALPAAAEDVVYGPDGAPTVLQHKLYPMSQQWELGVRLAAGLNQPLVIDYGGSLSLSYHPNESFDIGAEVYGGYTALSSLSDVIREKLPARNPMTPKDEIANTDQLRFGVAAIARIAPIYGKFNLSSEVPIHFQTYLLLGVGAGQLHHESVNLCAVAGTTACPQGDFQTTDSFTVVGEAGGGFRFYFSDKWSLSAEVRAYLFPAQYKADNDLTSPQSGTETTYLGSVVRFSLGIARLF
jgi:outer membrane beta-barrel protein